MIIIQKFITTSPMKRCLILSLCLLLLLSCSNKIQSKQEGDFAKISFEKSASLLETKKYTNKRLLIGFFSYKHKDALPMLNALSKLIKDEDKKNYKVIAISIDYNDINGLHDFIAKNKINMPVLMEGPSLSLLEKFKISSEVAFVGLDAKHQLRFGVKEYIFASKPTGEQEFLEYVSENLGLKKYQPMEPHLGYYPKVPDFSLKAYGGKIVSLKDYQDKVVLFVFFSVRCPHCKRELKFIQKELYPEYHKKGFEVLGVVSHKLTGKELELYESLNFPWPVVEDVGRVFRKKFTNNGSVPENFMMGKDGKIHYYSIGYAPMRNKLYHMQVKSLLGLSTVPDLSSTQLSGETTCLVCHEKEFVDWSVSPHAHTWDKIVMASEESNPECVGCHAVSFGNIKGYRVIKDKKTNEQVAQVYPHMMNVQCENCHGVGGGHSKHQKVTLKDMKKKCLSCHTKEWSPDFDVNKAIQKVNHSQASKIMQMSLEEKKTYIKQHK